MSIVSCLTFTPTDVCLPNRTKDSFCNADVNATGVIVCYGNSLGVEIACSSAEPDCLVGDSGDKCGVQSSSSSGASAPFLCTGLGYYPDPENCTLYYFCTYNTNKTEFIATPQRCESGNVFYPQTGSYCTRQNLFLNNCKKITCDFAPKNVTLSFVQIQYGFNKQYFAMCAPSKQPLIFVCPANSVPNLSAASPSCNYNCYRSGFFENSLDNTKYFECFINNFYRYQSVERRCPTGSTFNTSRSECSVNLRNLSLNATAG